MQPKEQYGLNREAGVRGQGRPIAGQIVGYTPAEKVVQGAYGSRKARRSRRSSHDRPGAPLGAQSEGMSAHPIKWLIHHAGWCHKQRLGYSYCRGLSDFAECGPFFEPK